MSKEDNVVIGSGMKIVMLFNFYIVFVWVVVVNVVFVMLFFIKFCFKNFFVFYMVMKFVIGEVKKLILYIVFFMLLVFFGMVCFWGVFSDLFVFVFG